MTPSVLIIGGQSFLAREFAKSAPPLSLKLIRHTDIGRPELLENVGVAINFTHDPASERRELPIEETPELRVANWLKGTGIHLVHLSSRRVYLRAPGPLTETSPVGSHTTGGKNKLNGELVLQKNIPEGNLTILRLGNIFGFEREVQRQTFFTRALFSLTESRNIYLDIEPGTVKDFLSVNSFSHALSNIALRRPPGVFNLGAGFSVAVGDVCKWLIEGFGYGSLVLRPSVHNDDFLLDCSKVSDYLGAKISKAAIQNEVTNVGKALAHEQS